MPDSVSMLFLLFVVVAVIFASVVAIIFSRVNALEDTIGFYRNEYATVKHRLYSLERELYKLRHERSGLWYSETATITTETPTQVEPKNEVKEQEQDE